MKVRLRLFAAAREAAGRGHDEIDVADGSDVNALLASLNCRYGDEFAAVLTTARVWINGDEPHAGMQTQLADADEVAILPPVSGGAL